MSRIHLSGPDVRGEELRFLVEAVESGWIAPVGPDLDRFEEEVAALCGRARAVGLSSGTAALHLALLTAGVGPGDDVLVSTFTFAASANPVVYVGARPVFVDADPASWTMSAELLADELADRAAAGRPPAAVVAVDLYGQCCDYDAIVPLLERYGVPLVEDAAEALGASWGGRPAGAFGAAAAFSFNGNKLVTTSGGGMLVTDDHDVADRARHLATQAREPAPHYEHVEIGFNYRLSNLLAAFGRGQLCQLAERIERRRWLFARYAEVLGAVPGVDMMPEAPGGTSTRWLTCCTIDPAEAGFGRDDLRSHLEAADIESRPTWKPMHLQPVFREAARRVDGTSERIFERGLCLPSGSGLSDAEVERVLSVIADLVDRRAP